jgi:hypothetical protein
MEERQTGVIVKDYEPFRKQDHDYALEVLNYVIPGLEPGLMKAFERGAIVLDITVPTNPNVDMKIEVEEPMPEILIRLLAALQGFATLDDVAGVLPYTAIVILRREGEPIRLGSGRAVTRKPS